MKALVVSVLLGISTFAYANTLIDLDGKTFCRTVNMGGMFGQPSGDSEHCVSFKDGRMTDNANTFFGNPPETLAYRLSGKQIEVQFQNKWEERYRQQNDQIVNESGAVLKLK